MKKLVLSFILFMLALAAECYAAYPTILVNSATGSDTAASGAGPSTALTGTVAQVGSNQTHVGLFEASAPDLSGVSATGNHVLYFADSSTGYRNFSSIVAVKNTEQTTTGTITNGSNSITLVASSAGMAVGDVIKVTGTTSFYATILSLVEDNIGINVNAGEDYSGATIYDAKGLTVATGEELHALQSGSWAIGGKRAAIGTTNSMKLFSNNAAAGDAMPGWTIEMESGHTETTSAITFRRAASAVGPITLRGTAGAATMPILTFSNNGTGIAAGSGVVGIHLENFEMRNSNATKTASSAISTSTYWVMRNLKITDSTNYFGRGIATSGGTLVENCKFANFAGYTGGSRAITATTANTGLNIRGCVFYNITGDGIAITMSTTNSIHTLIADNAIYSNTGAGITTVAGSGTSGLTYFGRIMRNTIHANGGAGIDFGSDSSTTNGWANALVENNNITANGTYGINFSNATPPTKAQLDYSNTVFWNNNFGTGATANTSGAFSIAGLGENSVYADPGYTDVSNADKSLWNFACGTGVKALGYPTNKIGNTQSYVDIGVAQRQEPTGGSGGEGNYVF